MRTSMLLCSSVLIGILGAVSCNNTDPVPLQTSDHDTTIVPDQETMPPESEALPPIDDQPAPDDEDCCLPDGDTDIPSPPDEDNPVLGKNCKLDSDCGAPFICVNAKCAEGCDSDADCTAYPNTTCNKKLGRCLNTTASDGACNETNCAVGCCYAGKGFQSLACTTATSFSICGICPQGQVYMDGKQCVPAACKVGETKCRDYNSSDPRAKCFECSAESDFVCVDNPQCVPGSTLRMINVTTCVPAGERCGAHDVCCSSLPCIQGYCY